MQLPHFCLGCLVKLVEDAVVGSELQVEMSSKNNTWSFNSAIQERVTLNHE